MTKVKKSWDTLTDPEKQSAIKEVISFFRDERGEEIGYIAAEAVLDMFLQKVGTKIYNKGVEDAKMLFRNRFEEVLTDVEATLKNLD